MKNLKLLILILVFCLPFSSLVRGSDTKVLKPKNATTKIKTIISGKSRDYYPVSKNNPSIISAKGPGKLRVITRVQFNYDEDEELDYVICCRLDGVEMEDVEFESVKRSYNALYRNYSLGVPGAGKDLILELGRGDTHHFDVETSIPKKGYRIPYSDVRATFINLRTKERFTKTVPPMFRDNFHYGTNVSLKKDKYEVIIEVGVPMLAREVTFNKWMQTTKVNFQFEVK